ncbi:MAG: T9SS type A sorting domain-containing protein [Saprospiraceae bacterium]
MKKHFLLTLGLVFKLLTLSAQAPAWQHIPGPDGGGVENFDMDGSALYALTRAGIYRSDDEGYHWKMLPRSLSTTRDKRQLRAENGIFYALDSKGSLLRSDDQGATWKPILQKPFPFDFETETLQQVFVKGDTLLVGSLFTIYRSTDRGETWTITADFAPASFVSIFEFKNELFAAQDRYIYRSSDGGMTWENVFANAVGYAAVTATDSFLLAFYADKNRLVRSTDGFRTWDAIDTDTIAKHLEEDPYGAYPSKWVGGSGQNLYYFQLGNVHYYCPFRFCHSSDGGNTWHRGNNGKQAPIGRELNDGINFENHLLLASERIQHSVDSARTFFEAQEDLKTAAIKQIVHHGASVFSNTRWERGHISNDGGETWATYPPPSESEYYCNSSLQFFPTNEKVFRFQSDPFEVFYTQDDGTTWKPLGAEVTGFVTATDHAFWHGDIVWENGNLFNRFWKIADSDTIAKPIHLVDFDPEKPFFWMFGLGDRLALLLLNDYVIFDENGNLIRHLPATPCSSSPFAPGSLYFDGNTYYNFCNDRAFILPHEAEDWQEIYPQDWTIGVPLYHSRMTFFVSHNGITWVGLEGKGLFYATDNTGRFYPAQPQMPYPYPTAISFDENSVWVGTDGGGIWTYPLPKTLTDPSQKPVFKIFPNPSQGELTLQSDSFFKEEIAFGVFDAAGRKVSEKRLSPGQYWNLDLPRLPKGLYFLQMRTESGVFGLKWVVEKALP